MKQLLTRLLKSIVTLSQKQGEKSICNVDVGPIFSQLITRFEKTRIICVKTPKNAHCNLSVFRRIKAYNLPCDSITWRELKKQDKTNGDGCVYYICAANEQQLAYFVRNKLCMVTSRDLLALDSNREFLSPDIPLMINTLENCYNSISVYGKSKYASGIRQYLEQNPNLDITEADRGGCGRSEVMLVIDLLPVGSFDVGYAIYWSDLFRHEITDAEGDIIRNIVPYLCKKGVSVLYVTAPDRFAFQKRFRVFAHMWRFMRLAIKDIRQFDTKLLNLFGSGYLAPEYFNLCVRTDRGYPRVIATGDHYNFRNGFRYTVGNHEKTNRALYLFGPCIVAGGYVEDKATIGSQLQKNLKRGDNVFNRGTCSDYGMNLNMRSVMYRNGDIAIVFINKQKLPHMDEVGVHRYDLTESYIKIADLSKHIGDSPYHCDNTVNQRIASDLQNCLNKIGYLDSSIDGDGASICFGSEIKRIPMFKVERYAALYAWLNGFSALRKDGNNGAIVMNCNPFTLGHEYLIKTAANAVDRLYVFVVEEDKSYFSFEDRLKLVSESTKDISNVIVLPSGRHMISSDTLPGYFTKETKANAYVDATDDMELFMQIAVYFHITTRYVGREPYDAFTRQYNENMKSMLPLYGINVVEIERTKIKDNYVSASMVRKCIERGELDTIKGMVPESTYEYIRKRFFQ